MKFCKEVFHEHARAFQGLPSGAPRHHHDDGQCRQRPSRRLPFGRRADDQRFLQPHARRSQQSARSRPRPLCALQGPRGAVLLCGACRQGLHLPRRIRELPSAPLHPAGPPRRQKGPGRGRLHRLARSGRVHRRRHGARREAPRQGYEGLCPRRRRRESGGADLGGLHGRRPL